jgi:hypothetical protein
MRLKEETDRFRKLTGKEAEASRFHYLRLKFPVSYQNLSDAGFREDYSMGYHDEPGFRAGTAMSFMFYNIEKESISNLRVFPFQVMDGTLYRYRSLNTGEAGQVISRLLGNCMECGGNFVSIWHNTSLLRSAEWQGWRELFESMLKN